MCYHKPPAVASPKNSFKDFPRLEALFFFSLFMTLDWGRVLTSVHHRSVQQEPERLKQPAVVYQKQKQALKAVERTGWEGPPGPFWTNLPGAKGVQSQAGVTRWSLSTGRCRNPPTRYIASTSCAHDPPPCGVPDAQPRFTGFNVLRTRLLECRQNVGNHAGRPEDVATTDTGTLSTKNSPRRSSNIVGCLSFFLHSTSSPAGYYTPFTTHQITNIGVLVVRMRMQNQIERGRLPDVRNTRAPCCPACVTGTGVVCTIS